MRQEKRGFKVVLDTNVFISSIFWRGNPHKIVELAVDKKIQIYTSPEILTELEEVLKRDFEEDHEFIERQVALILEYAKIVKPLKKVDFVKEDPEDNKIIECALTAKADYIVSGDQHLFFLKEIFGIKILKPKEFLDELSK
ncbi:MAG: putative toxin-antitoxin system toxin component, PIN family [Candidatus Woesearchaeota archaeon]|nr:MAG: putative toxin-antitoxin system toxin component, PIN family [Candidatus Woesearchaeota archaeon]